MFFLCLSLNSLIHRRYVDPLELSSDFSVYSLGPSSRFKRGCVSPVVRRETTVRREEAESAFWVAGPGGRFSDPLCFTGSCSSLVVRVSWCQFFWLGSGLSGSMLAWRGGCLRFLCRLGVLALEVSTFSQNEFVGISLQDEPRWLPLWRCQFRCSVGSERSLDSSTSGLYVLTTRISGCLPWSLSSPDYGFCSWSTHFGFAHIRLGSPDLVSIVSIVCLWLLLLLY